MFVFQNYEAMRRHGTRYHYSDKRRKLLVPEEDDAPTFTNSEEDDSGPTYLNNYYSFLNHNTESYINTCISRGCLFAIVQMVVSSCYGSHQVLPELLVSVDLDDVYLFLSIARLVTRMGTVNSSLLSTVLLMLGRNRDESKLPIPLSTPELSSIILNRSRKFSLISLLPLPFVHQLGKLNACISLNEILAHSIGFAESSSVINEKFQKIIECPKSKRVLQAGKELITDHSCTYSVLLIFWFDGWDAASSLTKANKNPIWSGVITMIFVDHNDNLVTVATRLMSVGPGKGDHTPVLEKLKNDYYDMRKERDAQSYYCNLSRSWKKLLPSLLFLWCDQPEKRQICGLLGGNSNNGPCFGVSCNFQKLRKTIEACHQCRLLLTAYSKDSGKTPFDHTLCNYCWQWELPNDSSLMKYTHPIHDSFPVGIFPGYKLNSQAGLVDTFLLKSAWTHAYTAFVTDKWTSQQVKNYLGLLLINDKTIQILLNNGNRVVMLNYANRANCDVLDDITKTEILDDFNQNPLMYKLPPHPPMWDFVELDDLLEVPMHMMGIVKAVSKLVHKWSQKVGCRHILVSHLNVLIHMHQRFCRIGRHPFAQYSKDNKFPGWVSDTFRTWYKLMPWLYQCVCLPEFKFIPYQEPETPWRQWNKTVCSSYCSARGVTGAASMLISELKQIIQSWVESDDGPPACVIPNANKVTGKDIREMIWYCHSTFKFWLCTGTNSTHNKAMVNAKLFLSKINEIDRSVNKEESTLTKPIYLAKYNLISLMRAMKQLKQYDSARYVHEGGPEGEGIVKELRPLIPAGLKDNFSKNLIDTWNRDHELTRSAKIVMDEGKVQCKVIRDMTNGFSALNPTQEEMLSDGNLEMRVEDCPTSLQYKVSQASNLTMNPVYEPGEDVSIHSDVYEFCRYESFQVVHKYIELGLPISVVFVRLINGVIKMGAVVGKRGEWFLYSIVPKHQQLNDDFGFNYFHLSYPLPEDVSEVMLRNKKKEIQFPIQNYAFLLPNLTMSGGTKEDNGNEENLNECSYAILTSELYHLDSNHHFTR